MPMTNDALNMIKDRMRDRIDQIAHELPHLSRFALAHQIDDIRRTATDHQFAALCDVASALESSLSESHDHLIVLPFLELMRDTLDIAPGDHAAGAPYLVAAHQRRYG